MHTDEPREVEGRDLGYDPRDIDAPKIYKVVLGFFAFALVFFGLGAVYYIWIGKIETGQRFDPRKPAIVGPKIQGNVAAKIDLMQMRQDERAQIESYGKDEETLATGQKVARQRIPVARAMQLLAQRGLPVIKNDEKATSPGNTIPQNAVGPAPSSTNTSPAQTPPVPTPDAGQGATGSTGGSSVP